MATEKDMEQIKNAALYIAVASLIITLYFFGGFALIIAATISYFGTSFLVGFIGGLVIRFRDSFRN